LNVARTWPIGSRSFFMTRPPRARQLSTTIRALHVAGGDAMLAAMDAMDTLLDATAICRDFPTPAGTVRVLHEVSLSVSRGRLTILRGPSGSGKTTLLNILGALDTPTSGRILLDGAEISSAPEGERDRTRRRSMGFVFQSVALIGSMSAFENVDFGLRVAGADSRTRSQRAEECLAQVGLRSRMHHRPHELSGGEQQRVAIARAIAHQPRVVFADEPTAELDTHLGLAVMKLFRELLDQSGITIVMTTHDPGMMDLADRVFTLEDGRIVDER
jgi:putative ABC transport system ATP-binding protein